MVVIQPKVDNTDFYKFGVQIMNKNILVINSTVPHPFHGGGGLTIYSSLRALLNNGYNVYCLALTCSSNNGSKSEQDHIDHLLSLGVKDVQILDITKENHHPKLFDRVFPSIQSLLPFRKFNSKVEKYIKKFNISSILAYHWEASSAVMDLSNIKKAFFLGDPIDAPMIFRRQYLNKYGELSYFRNIVFNIRSKLIISQQRLAMNKVIEKGNFVGVFAKHHSEELQTRSKRDCQYIKTPTPSSVSKNNLKTVGKKFKILHIGHLQGIATVSGVDLLVNQIIPILKKEIGSENLEINLVGGSFNSLPRALQDSINKEDQINVLGQITPADQVFCENDILLVPTPIELGIRVRIITGLSYSIPVVAHIANKKGIPELENNINCILGKNAEEIAQGIIKLYKDENLRKKIGEEGLDLHNNEFSITSFQKTLSSIFQDFYQ